MSYALKDFITRSLESVHAVVMIEKRTRHYVLSAAHERSYKKVPRDTSADVAFEHRNWDFFQKQYIKQKQRA